MTREEAIGLLERIKCRINYEVTDAQKKMDALNIAIEALSSSEKPKMGQWKRISIDKYVQHAMAYYRCSECGRNIIGTHNYCPSCGAKMQSVEEVEE